MGSAGADRKDSGFAAPELRELRYFVALAEELHFGRTADRLFLSQPALSQAISKLETKLHSQLFKRGKGGVTLTNDGRELVDEARRVLASVERFTSTAYALAAGPTGSLTVGYVPSIQHTVAAAIRRFTADTGMLVNHQRLSHTSIVRGVEGGALDVGIGASAVLPDTLSPDVEAVHYRSLRVEAAVPAGHPLARNLSVELADLVPYPIAFVSITGREIWRRLFGLYSLDPEFIAIPDPISSAPLDLEDNAPLAVWLQTTEYASSGALAPLTVEPAVGVSFSFFFKPESDHPEIASLVRRLKASEPNEPRVTLVAV